MRTGRPSAPASARWQPDADATGPGAAAFTFVGAVVGFVAANGSHVWRGIPYTAPPTGALRWRAPRDPQPWPGTRESLAFGPRCPQYTSSLEATRELGTVYGSEDCLTLNVWAPPHAGAERLPVMFWIHGGGNVQGGSDFYDGAALAVNQRVVVVSSNYRLAAPRRAARGRHRRGGVGQLRHARHDPRSALGARQHRRVRRQSG